MVLKDYVLLASLVYRKEQHHNFMLLLVYECTPHCKLLKRHFVNIEAVQVPVNITSKKTSIGKTVKLTVLTY